MNQTQRNFLIKKIEESVKTRIKILEDCRPKHPSINNWLLHAVLSNKFDLQPIENIKECLRQMALKANDREDWLRNHWGSASKSLINFLPEEIFIIPDEYKQRRDEYKTELKEIDDQIYQLRIQSDTLITRIQLASDKTLDRMISEVDDMGDISLIDTKLKLLTT